MLRMKKTLLTNFIQDRIDSIGETTSRKKYEASLWTALTEKQQKEIAEELEISHGSLRVYRTEESFRGLENDHREAFKDYLVGYFNGKHKQYAAAVERLLSKEARRVWELALPKVTFPELSDAYIWEKGLKKEIIDIIIKRLAKDYEDTPFEIELMKLLRKTFGWYTSDQIWEEFSNLLLFLVSHDIVAASVEKNSKFYLSRAVYYSNVLKELRKQS